MAGYLFEPPPSPFETKLPSGTPINWSDPLSAGLVWCWPVNEGCGTFLCEVADAHRRQSLRWGPDIIVGTGANVPEWTTYEKAQALRLYGNVGGGANAQILVNAYAGADPGDHVLPPIDFTHGITLEFWGRSFAPNNIGQYAMLQLRTFNAGNIADLWMGGGAPLNNVRLRYFATDACATAPFSDHASIPNHIVATCTEGGDAVIYGNGVPIATGHLTVTPFSLFDRENSLSVNIGRNTNLQVTNYEGVLYKASIYNVALGPDAVQALAENPMRVLKSTRYPGVFAGVAPVIPTVSLVAIPDTIVEGDSSTLTWGSTDAVTLQIDQSIGSVVVPAGSTIVSPAVTTTYSILATNTFGIATASATVNVVASGGGGGGGSPGVSSGAILQRDLSKFSDRALGPTDNGLLYDAYATIGSVVLTHPSELALLLAITTEAMAVGSHPGVSVLLDEIATSVPAPFEALGTPVPDPPVLVAAQTIYNDRFYISETQQPAVCRHLQVKLSWPSEAMKNELLTWSIIGASVEER